MEVVGAGHPYVPADLELPDYVPVFLNQSTIVGVYLLTSMVIVSIVWIVSGNSSVSLQFESMVLQCCLFYCPYSYISCYFA